MQELQAVWWCWLAGAGCGACIFGGRVLDGRRWRFQFVWRFSAGRRAGWKIQMEEHSCWGVGVWF